MMSALLGALVPSYGLNASQQGNLALMNALGLMLASSVAGPMVDWKGKRLGLLAGLSLIFVALVAAPNSVGYGSLAAVYFVLGVGGGTISTSVNSLASDIAPQRRASALNFVNLFFGLGGVVTTLAASYLLTGSMLCYSIAALAGGALLLVVFIPMANRANEISFHLNQVPALLRNPTLLALSLLLFLYVACEVGVWNWLKIYLISIHFDARTAGGIVSYGFAFGMLVGRGAASRVLSHTAAMRVIIISGMLITATTFFMLHVSSQTGVTIAVFAAGLAMAPVFPTTLSVVGAHFPKAAASSMGIAITCGWLGLAASSPLIGSIAERRTLRSGLLVLPATAGAMVLVALVLNIRLRKVART
jgi:fucose permease